MPYQERKISKEIYENALKHGGYLTEKDKAKVFDVCELCGYGFMEQRRMKKMANITACITGAVHVIRGWQGETNGKPNKIRNRPFAETWV